MIGAFNTNHLTIVQYSSPRPFCGRAWIGGPILLTDIFVLDVKICLGLDVCLASGTLKIGPELDGFLASGASAFK